MAPRQPVLLLEEEGAGEFEPDAEQLRPLDQDRAERGDGLVEQLLAPVGLGARGLLHGEHAQAELGGGEILGGGRRDEQKDQGKAQSRNKWTNFVHSRFSVDLVHVECDSAEEREGAATLAAAPVIIGSLLATTCAPRSRRSPRPWRRPRTGHTRPRTCRRSRAVGRLWFRYQWGGRCRNCASHVPLSSGTPSIVQVTSAAVTVPPVMSSRFRARDQLGSLLNPVIVPETVSASKSA